MSTAMDIDPVDPEDDPVIAEYNIFMTPALKEQLLLLQYPNRKRDAPYDSKEGTLPSELRIKPETGFLEIDIGVSTEQNFDKIKGVQWGTALKHAKDSKAKGFGMSSGFGKGNEDLKVLVSGGAGRREDGGDHERMVQEFEGRRERGAVLEKQTLGGMIRRGGEGPVSMVGVFKGDELHLTPLSGFTQLRPQFHHLDAQSSITRHSLRTLNPSSSSKGPTPKAAAPVTTAVSSNDPTESTGKSTQDATDEFLNKAADENWRRCWYRDEMDDDAFAMYGERLVLGEGRQERATEVRSQWSSKEYLDAIRTGGVVEEEKPAPTKKAAVKKKVVKKGDAVAGPSKR